MAGRGNFAPREKKKGKKDPKKIAPLSISAPPAEVELIRKKRKPREEEEE
jgi:hypothetical protein